ncbi:MAG: hypothetical protein KAH46_25550 [Mycobacterium sp.]|nr:hypothetical protein [Mycobacterium sp.]
MSSPDNGPGGRITEIRSGGRYKASTLILSLLLLVVLVGAAVAVAVSYDDDSDAPQPGNTGVAAPQTAPSASALPPNAFGIPTTDLHGRRVETPTNPLGQVLPQTGAASPSSSASGDASTSGTVAAPSGLMWQRVYGEPLPFSTSDGPTAINAQGVPTGFSHTPQGAVLAAWQLTQRATWAPDVQNRALFAQAAVVSDAARPDVETMSNNEAQFNASTPGISPGAFDVPIAVRVSNYAADYAHVDVAIPTPPERSDGVVALSVGIDVVWRDNTWKWVVPPAGTDASSPITNIDGWSTW